jgi:hypothetical protein
MVERLSSLDFDLWVLLCGFGPWKFVMMVGFGFGYDGLLAFFWTFFTLSYNRNLLHYVFQNMHGGRLILHWWWDILFFWFASTFKRKIFLLPTLNNGELFSTLTISYDVNCVKD